MVKKLESEIRIYWKNGALQINMPKSFASDSAFPIDKSANRLFAIVEDEKIILLEKKP